MPEKTLFLPKEDLKPKFVVGQLSEIQDWGYQYFDAPDAHKHTKGEGIRVAVLDTGIPQHQDLDENIERGYQAIFNGTPLDKQGHATHISGIIAAVENGFGVVGIAPKAKIVPIKVLDDSGLADYDEIERGVRFAIDAKVDIMNFSFGAPFPPPDTFIALIKEAADKGIIMVAAAGNDAGNVNYPALLDEVIAVAAIDKDGKLANFSSRGDKAKIAAPGVRIYSTYLNNSYASFDGTSVAAPGISAICALLLAWSRKTIGVIPITAVKEMLNRLDDITDNHGRVSTDINGMGYGIPKFCNMKWD